MKLIWLKVLLWNSERAIDAITKQRIEVKKSASSFDTQSAYEIARHVENASAMRAQIVELGGQP